MTTRGRIISCVVVVLIMAALVFGLFAFHARFGDAAGITLCLTGIIIIVLVVRVVAMQAGAAASEEVEAVSVRASIDDRGQAVLSVIGRKPIEIRLSVETLRALQRQIEEELSLP